MKDKSILSNRTFLCIVAINFFTGFVFYLLITTLAGHVQDYYQVDESMAGIAVGAYGFGALLARIIVGPNLENWGRKRTAYFGTLGYTVLMAAYFIAVDYWLLVVIRFIHGAMFSTSQNALNTVAINLMAEDRKGEGTAYLTMGPTLATAIGPAIGIIIVQQDISYNAVMILAFACTVGSGASVLLAKIDPDPDKFRLRTAKARSLAIIEKEALPISFIYGMCAIAYAAVTTFVSNYAEEIGLQSAASFYFTVYAIAILTARPVAGKILDKKGGNYTIYPTLTIFGIGFFLLGGAETSAVMLITAACIGIGYGIMSSCGLALAVKDLPSERVGLANSTFYVFGDTGVTLGSMITGALIAPLGYAGMYRVLTVIPILGMICFWWSTHRKAR